MLQAMYNGVSAISATQQDMDVIGNNIANVNTTAYKGSDVTFADQLTQTLQGASSATNSVGGTNPMQTGTGVKIASITQNDAQGSLLSTSSPTDLAIQGNGYFMLSNPNYGITYSRDGHFALDNSGNVVDATTGEFVLGWATGPGGTLNTSAQITPASKIQIGIGQTTAVNPTSNISFTGNLSADTAGAGSITTTETVYDSLGEPHALTLTFTRQTGTGGTASNTWQWTASGDSVSGTGTDATNNETINSGYVTFDANGNPTTNPAGDATGEIQLNPTNGSATGQTIQLNFSGASQVSGASSFGPESQDGYASGTLASFTINQQGVITGTFSNGLTRALGQIALSAFNNPQGLSEVGNNEYTPTVNSGQAIVGQADTLGLGTVSSGYLEQSNVDLGTELTNMIVAQQAFAANTKIVTAVDQMLSTLVQMKQ